MNAADAPPAVRVVIVRPLGDPFEAEQHEGGPSPTDPAHLDVLHRLFYDSSVDLGALVRLGPITYICTRAGWRVHRE